MLLNRDVFEVGFGRLEERIGYFIHRGTVEVGLLGFAVVEGHIFEHRVFKGRATDGRFIEHSAV